VVWNDLFGGDRDNVFLYILAICVFFLALITFLMVYFVIHYRREKHPQPVDIEGSTWLEVTWTVIPTLIVLTMFYYGLTSFQFLKKVPEGAMVVKVIARQWSWLFEYENGMKETELKVPLGKPSFTAFMPLPSGLNRMLCRE
jgi:cytochrome c oxidase subunit 2